LVPADVAGHLPSSHSIWTSNNPYGSIGNFDAVDQRAGDEMLRMRTSPVVIARSICGAQHPSIAGYRAAEPCSPDRGGLAAGGLGWRMTLRSARACHRHSPGCGCSLVRGSNSNISDFNALGCGSPCRVRGGRGHDRLDDLRRLRLPGTRARPKLWSILILSNGAFLRSRGERIPLPKSV